MLDKRLVLRLFLLIIRALEYHLAGTLEINAHNKVWFQSKANDTLVSAKYTLAHLITVNGYTLAKLEKD